MSTLPKDCCLTATYLDEIHMHVNKIRVAFGFSHFNEIAPEVLEWDGMIFYRGEMDCLMHDEREYCSVRFYYNTGCYSSEGKKRIIDSSYKICFWHGKEPNLFKSMSAFCTSIEGELYWRGSLSAFETTYGKMFMVYPEEKIIYVTHNKSWGQR